MPKRIAVCGAPQVGKTTLLNTLVTLTGSNTALRSCSPYEMITRVDIQAPHPPMTLITLSGAVLYEQSSAPAWLVSNVHAIVYVLAALDPQLDQRWYSGATADECTRQHVFWDLYTTYATQAASLWTNIPWFVFLNTFDQGTANPLQALLPPALLKNLLVGNATTERDIIPLWERFKPI